MGIQFELKARYVIFLSGGRKEIILCMEFLNTIRDVQFSTQIFLMNLGAMNYEFLY